MNEPLTPEELRSLLGAFALGAVDDTERQQMEQFVLDDRDARAELHQLEHAVAWLGHASPRPSSASWEAVRAEIDADMGREQSTSGEPTSGEPRFDEPRSGEVVSLASFQSRRTTHGWRRLTAVAAAAALVVGSAVAVTRLIERDSSSPAQTVALRSPSGATAVVARIQSNGDGTITTSDLPTPPAGHVYQLWSQPTATSPMHSAGVLGRSARGHRIRIPAHTLRIAISVEPDGGSPEPTTDPVAISALGAL